MRVEETIEAKLARWSRDARQLATCSDCYGVGQDMRADDCRACPVCNGSGKAAREPHVVELVEMVAEKDARLEAMGEMVEAVASLLRARDVELSEMREEVDRLRSELYRMRSERLREQSE